LFSLYSTPASVFKNYFAMAAATQDIHKSKHKEHKT